MSTVYQHFFGSSIMLNKILDLVRDFRIGNQGQFDNVTTLTTCALQAFSVKNDSNSSNESRPDFNVMPRFAKEKFHDWYDGHMDNMTVEQLCKFAERVDISFDIKNKNSRNDSLNDIKDHHRLIIKSMSPFKTKQVTIFTTPASPTVRKPVKSILKKRPWTPKYSRSLLLHLVQ